MSSSPAILARLDKRCPGDHAHQELLSGRAAAAAVYPDELVRAIIMGADDQRRREGTTLPAGLLSALDSGTAIYDLAKDDAEIANGPEWKRVEPCGGRA